MANDPMTVDSSEEITLRDGVHMVILVVSGPADYDATLGANFDLSDYVSTVKYIKFGACTLKGDALVIPRYVSADLDDSEVGDVYFTWQKADSLEGSVMENVVTGVTAALEGYQWQVLLIGDPA